MATQHLVKVFLILKKLIHYESCLLKVKLELTIPAFLKQGYKHVTLFLQSDEDMQERSIEEETMKKQVSGRMSFLVRAVELVSSTKAEMAAALVSASPVGVISAATATVPVAVPVTLSSSVIWM